jgi:hypothetical protein
MAGEPAAPAAPAQDMDVDPVEADTAAVTVSDDDSPARPTTGGKGIARPTTGGKSIASLAQFAKSGVNRSKSPDLDTALERLDYVCVDDSDEWHAAVQIIEEEIDNVKDAGVAASQVMRRVKDALKRA